MSRVSRRLALASAAVLLVSAVSAAPVSAADPTSVSCTYDSGNGALSATFNVDPSGYYAWAWRSGWRGLGGGVDTLTTGSSITKTATTSRLGLTASNVKFGIVSLANPMDYTYVACTAP